MRDASSPLQVLVGGRQNDRIMRLTFPDSDGPQSELVVNKLDAFEEISKPFEYTLELLSDAPDLELKELQGKMICVELVRRDGTLRYFTGRVFGFRLKSVDGGVSYYEARLGPWLKYLAARKDNYLFHSTTLYEQTASIFADYGGLAAWDWRVTSATEVLTDCCQFDEADSNFLERRWASLGIHYWFEHDQAGHKLVLSDDSTVGLPIDGDVEVPFQRHGGAVEEDGISEWTPYRKFVAGTVSLASFDFKSPRPVHVSIPTNNRQGKVLNVETYEYTGAYGYQSMAAGNAMAKLRIEEIEAAGKQFKGQGNNRQLMPGRWFRLTGHFDCPPTGASQDACEFLILAVRHTATNNYQVRESSESQYSNRFRCIRRVIPYRPGRSHNSRETKIYGIQTATVVGPPGEEIHTDEFGRVRVQFHWDRVGVFDDKSSSLVRVATSWAGPNFGMTSIPRIGSEVLISFLDGNPNRPIVIGMVPNAQNMPPWSLPSNKTQSGILSRSTPGGQYHHANALRFEDKKGHEQLWLHAEKDQLTEVENDEEKWVGRDRRKTVDRDETSHIKHDRTETVDHDELITVHHDRSERVDREETISIGGNRTKVVERNERDRILKNWSTHVFKTKTETIGMAYMQNVGMGRLENVGMGYSLNVGLAMTTLVGLNQVTKVGKKISISAGDELSITVGKASFVMRADGSISIHGTKFNFEASGPVQISGKDVDVN